MSEHELDTIVDMKVAPAEIWIFEFSAFSKFRKMKFQIILNYKKNFSQKIFFQLSGGGLGKPDPRREGDEMAFFESMMSAAPAPSAEVFHLKLPGDEEIWGMSLFDNIEDEKRYAKEVEASQQVTVIDAREKKKSLKAAMEDMQIDAKRPPTSAGEKKKKNKGANMLDLLDEAVARPATAKKGTKAKRSESIGAKTTTAPKSDDPAKPRTRSGSRPTTTNRPATKSEGRAEARPPTKSDSRPGTKNGGASRPATKSATRPTTASRPASKSTERAGSAAPKRAGSAKKKSVVPEQAS
ncbi:Protein CBG15735 [Caenorhabditis briggsae]|uniref:Protein CBG15735 n=1 Tax=Caenorhabditis briggsae TaxID=6238 RepID=A8XMN4_CAEBR|nr:Protein CBG15735 [Caenorhabditis briggsae]CAP33910.1 Protein CBG15735 [Caenorhabditis briggsae]